MTSLPDSQSDPVNGTEPTIALDNNYEQSPGGRRQSEFDRENVPKILGDYVIEDEIGRGGMGVVYRAIEKGLGRTVALKVLPNSSKLTAARVSRFQLEAKSAAQLTHENIIPVYHVGHENGTHFFAMRLIEGCNVEQLISQAKHAVYTASVGTTAPSSSDGEASDIPLSQSRKTSVHSGPASGPASQGEHGSIDTIIDLTLASLSTGAYSNGMHGVRTAHRLAVCIAQLGQAVADALHHAHQHGIIHRDIKPSNLMLDEHNKIWVTDFGLAQLQGQEGLTNTGEFLGTLRYTSPEQASGRRVFVDHRTDIYSLGVTLYEMATLQKACPGDSPREILRSLTFSSPLPVRKINPRLPKDFETILCRATERNPAMRYQTAAEFARDLSRFAKGEPLLLVRPQRIKRILSWLMERPMVASMMLAFTALACVSMFVVSVLAKQSSDAEHNRAEMAEHLVNVREAQQLSAAALLVKDDNPGMAIAAALAGAQVAMGPPSELALMASIDVNHERRTIPIDVEHPGNLAVSPDGRIAVVCSNPIAFANAKRSAPVIELSSGKVLGELECPTPITAAVFDPTGRFIITNSNPFRAAAAALGQQDPTVKGETQLWDALSLRLLKSLTQSTVLRIGRANFSPNGRQVVLPTEQGSATVYELPMLTPVLVLPSAHGEAVVDAVFSHDGKRIATLARNATVIAWNAEDGAKLQNFEYRTDLPTSTTIAFTHDPNRLCISGARGSIVVSLKDGSTRFSRREPLIACSSLDHWGYFLNLNNRSVQLVNLDTGLVESQCVAPRSIQAATLSSDGRTLALACGESIEIYDGRSVEHLASLRGHTDHVQSVALMDQPQQIASLGLDGTLRIWTKQSDLQSRTLSSLIERMQPHILSVDATGTLAAVGNTRSQRTSLRDIGQPNAATAQFNGDFQLLLSNRQLLTSRPGSCSLWEVETQRKVQSIELPGDPQRHVVQAIELSQQQIALLCDQQQLFIWDLVSNSISRITLTGESVNAIVKTSDSRAMIGLTNGELVEILLPTLQRQRIHQFGTAIMDLEMGTAKDQLLVSTQNKDLIAYDLANRTPSTTIPGIEQRVPSISPVSNGRCLSHAYLYSKSLKVWNLDSKKMDHELPVQGVVHAEVSRDGNSALVITSDRAMIWYWDEDRIETIVQRACSSGCYLGDQALLVTRPEPTTNQAEGAHHAPQLIVWDIASRSVLRSEDLTVLPKSIVASDSKDKFWLLNNAFGLDIVNLQSNKVVATIESFLSAIIAAEFLPATQEVLTVSRDGQIQATRIDSGKIRTIGSHPGAIQAAAISKDRRLLITADGLGDIWKWDVTTATMVGKVETGGMPARWLSISDSGNTAAALLGRNECLLWDFRTNASIRHKSEQDIVSAWVSSSGNKLLLALGNEAEMGTDVKPSQPERVVAEIVSLDKDKSLSLRAKHAALEGCFLSDEKFVVLLPERRTGVVFDVATGKEASQIVTQRPITRLLMSDTEPNTVFAVAGQQISGWTAEGTQVSAFAVPDLSMDIADRIRPKLIRAPDSPWYLVFAGDHVVKQPVKPLEYAKQVAPRTLTERELRSILWTPLNAPQ